MCGTFALTSASCLTTSHEYWRAHGGSTSFFGFYSCVGLAAPELGERSCGGGGGHGTLGIELSGERAFSTVHRRAAPLLLARALVNVRHSALDEPTSGLDLKTSFLYRTCWGLCEGADHPAGHHRIPRYSECSTLSAQAGRVLAPGAGGQLTSEALSALFACPLHVVLANGDLPGVPAA